MREWVVKAEMAEMAFPKGPCFATQIADSGWYPCRVKKNPPNRVTGRSLCFSGGLFADLEERKLPKNRERARERNNAPESTFEKLSMTEFWGRTDEAHEAGILQPLRARDF